MRIGLAIHIEIEEMSDELDTIVDRITARLGHLSWSQ